MQTHTHGLTAALFTPLRPDGRVNYELLPALMQHLGASGLSGVFICGSNGEGPSLTTAERKDVAEILIRNNPGRLKTMVHVGHASIAEARELARHGRDTGADAISSVAAFYFKPTSVQNLADSMAEIAAGAPELPFYYYHIPALTRITVDMPEFMRLAEKQIPNFAGIKYTAATLWEYMTCLRYNGGKYDVLYGFDENHLAALAVGAKGAIGSTFCFAAPVYLEVRNLFEAGKLAEARELMFWLAEMVRIIVQFPPVPAQKAVMKMIGFDMGPCRKPLQELSETAYNSLFVSLEAHGFFEKPGIA